MPALVRFARLRFDFQSAIVRVSRRGPRLRGVSKMSLAVETKVPALEDYFGLSEGELHARIEAVRRALGPRLVILGHHYQRDDVICHADFTGDSFKLSQLTASRPEVEFIVFCGV